MNLEIILPYTFLFSAPWAGRLDMAVSFKKLKFFLKAFRTENSGVFKNAALKTSG